MLQSSKHSGLILLLLLAALISAKSSAFTAVDLSIFRSGESRHQVSASTSVPVSSLFSTTAPTSQDEDVSVNVGILPRDRYVVTNRFAVRRNQQAKFELRWATRKSRLATLDGFKYFHLMRRVTRNNNSWTYDQGETDPEAQDNYLSFTIWNTKKDFSAWRSGEAFKEAHGGTSIGAFLSTMMNSALVLRGPPRPAFYDGLLPQESTETLSATPTVDGWRADIQADGLNTLPAECFVEMTSYFVPSNHVVEFEKAYAEQLKSTQKEKAGLITRILLRRDVKVKGFVIFLILVVVLPF